MYTQETKPAIVMSVEENAGVYHRVSFFDLRKLELGFAESIEGLAVSTAEMHEDFIILNFGEIMEDVWWSRD